MTVDELQVLITANTTALQKEIEKTNKNINGLKKSADKTQNGVTSAFKKLKSGIVALGIGKVIKDSIQMGMDAVESDSLFETSLGKWADSVRDWSNETANVLGLNAIAMRKNTGVIYNMTSSMGVAEDSALKMSKGITLLSEDMASFYNLNSSEAFNKLRAGLTGETEPLKALGILVDENTIKQVAYSEGIAQNGAELTQQQKVLARYVAILKQTGNAQGDLARTINSPANQLRLLKNQVSQLGLAFSNFLMPVISAVLPYLTAFTKVVTSALNSLASFMGLKSTNASDETAKISSNVGGLGSGLDDANKKAKKLKDSLAGFDEMNVLQDNSSDTDSDSSSTGGASVGGIDFNLDEYDAHLDWVSSKTDAIAEKIKSAFNGINFNNLIKSFSNLKKSIEPLTSNLFNGLKWAYDNVLAPIANWTIEGLLPSFINILSGGLNVLNAVCAELQPIWQWFWDNFLSPIAEWTGGVIVDVLNGIATAFDWISKNEVAVTILTSLAMVIGLVTGAITAYNVVMGICNVVTGIFSGIMGFLTSPITLVVLAITALITIITLCVKHWDDIKNAAVSCWKVIKGVWETVANWFNKTVIEPITNFFSSMWNGLINGAKNAWNGIKSVFSTVASFFKNIFTNAWTAVKNVFSVGGKIFDGIKDGIVTAFKTIVNGIIGGINKVVSIPFNAINGVLQKIHDVDILGVKPFKWIYTFNVPQIPKLAQGGVVDKPTYAMIGEAGKEVVMPLERNTEWITQLAGEINNRSGDSNRPIQLVVNIGDEKLFDKFIDRIKEKDFETNGGVFDI